MKEKKDTTWSIQHEGPLNPGNIIFTSNKYKELYETLKKVNDSIGDIDRGALISNCCNGSCITEPIDDDPPVGICSVCKDWTDFIYENDLED